MRRQPLDHLPPPQADGGELICRAAPGGAFCAPLRGASDVPPSAAKIAGSRPGRRGTFFASKKVPKEGRLRGLRRPLRDPLEYLARTRKLPSLPTGAPAEGSIQVAGAPNGRSRMARQNHTAENNARSGRSRALPACAAKPRSFPPPRGRYAPRKSGRASPMGTTGTVPGILGQRHCARGAAAGGMLYTCPFIRDGAPPTLAEGQPEAALGSQGFGRRPS